MQSLKDSWIKFEKSGDPRDYLIFCELRKKRSSSEEDKPSDRAQS